MEPLPNEYKLIGGVVRNLMGHTGKITKLAWNYDGTILATASEDSTIRLWRFDHAAINAGAAAAQGQPAGSAGLPKMSKVLKGHTGPVDCIAWSPTERWVLASAAADGTLRLWDTRDSAGPEGRVDALLAVSNNADNICFNSTGSTIAMGTRSDELVLIDVRGGRPSILGRNKFAMQLNEIAWTPSGLIFAMCTNKSTPPMEEGFLVVVRPNLPSSLSSSGTAGAPSASASASAPASATATGAGAGSSSGSAPVSSASAATPAGPAVGTLTPVHQALAHTVGANTIAFDRTHRFFATGGNDSIVSLWESSDVTCIRTFDRNETLIRNLSFSSDGTLLASASDDKAMEIVSDDASACSRGGSVNGL